MVIGGITKDGLSRSKVDSCRIYSLREKINLILCVQCGKWIHSICAGVKRMTPKSSRNITSRKCDGNIGEAVEQEDKLCDKVETVREFKYLGDSVSVGGECEAAVTARTRCGWVKSMECDELQYGRMFPLK